MTQTKVVKYFLNFVKSHHGVPERLSTATFDTNITLHETTYFYDNL